MILGSLGYIADVWILGTYALLSRTGKARPFHWANAVGCFPLLLAEYYAGLWQVMVLTGTFGALGWLGLWNNGGKK